MSTIDETTRPANVGLQRPVVIAVLSGKGGVGKMTCNSLLASLYAFLRNDRVIAVDTNPDFEMLEEGR